MGGKPGSMFNIPKLDGQRFGRLLVTQRVANRGTHACWLCECDCGRQCEVAGTLLKSGMTTSCGCYRLERLKQSLQTHGMTGTVEHQTWKRLRARCSNPNLPDYPDYGGRGIKVCDRWKDSFADFFEDMGSRPGKGYSIDRIDVNGDYCPENCRWATASQQASNKRKMLIEYEGRTLSVADWSLEFQVNPTTIYTLLKSNRNTQQVFKEWEDEKLARTR